MSTGVGNRLFHKGTVDQATSLDQRRFRRYGIKLPCHVKPRASGKSPVLPELIVETPDVSGGGLFFLASAKWPVGTDIEFELDIATHRKRRGGKHSMLGYSYPCRRERRGTRWYWGYHRSLQNLHIKEDKQGSSRQGCESGGVRVPLPSCLE